MAYEEKIKTATKMEDDIQKKVDIKKAQVDAFRRTLEKAQSNVDKEKTDLISLEQDLAEAMNKKHDLQIAEQKERDKAA